MTSSPTRQKRTIGKPAVCHACKGLYVLQTAWQKFCTPACRLSSYRNRPHTCRCGQLHRPRKPRPKVAKVRHMKRCVEECPGCRG